MCLIFQVGKKNNWSMIVSEFKPKKRSNTAACLPWHRNTGNYWCSVCVFGDWFRVVKVGGLLSQKNPADGPSFLLEFVACNCPFTTGRTNRMTFCQYAQTLQETRNSSVFWCPIFCSKLFDLPDFRCEIFPSTNSPDWAFCWGNFSQLDSFAEHKSSSENCCCCCCCSFQICQKPKKDLYLEKMRTHETFVADR